MTNEKDNHAHHTKRHETGYASPFVLLRVISWLSFRRVAYPLFAILTNSLPQTAFITFLKSAFSGKPSMMLTRSD